MILNKKSDVKSHLSARRRTSAHAIQLLPRPANGGLPANEQAAAEANEQAFPGDFSLEHFSPGGSVTAVVIATPDDTQVSEVPRIPQP